ncbi:MAG: sulfatase-like hydrolase/transferase [Planctomycetaceae bacterium]
MTRSQVAFRTSMIAVLVVGLQVSHVAIVEASSSAKSPNVLLVMTDDQGYGDFSLHGNPHLQTPHLDQLGRSGVQFERFFVNSFCAPTRAALLTDIRCEPAVTV